MMTAHKTICVLSFIFLTSVFSAQAFAQNAQPSENANPAATTLAPSGPPANPAPAHAAQPAQANQAARAAASSATLKIDATRSKISFVSEAPAEKIVGTASEVKGNIEWNLAALEASKGTISFPVSTMETGNRLRDRHLKGKDWLNERANPNVEFRLDRLENVTRTTDGDQVIVEADTVGQVTVNGVAAPNRGRVRITILEARKLARIQPTLTIALADHKVEGKRGIVGDKVGETIEIEGVIYGNWE